MSQSCLAKQKQLKDIFLSCSSTEEKYEKLIELGKEQTSLPPSCKTIDYFVTGCQSQTYLCSKMSGNLIIFMAESDALISAGLAMLLTKVYSDEAPEVILKYPPTYLEELGVIASLTPNRVNGLYSIHLRMKQEAIKHLAQIAQTKSSS